MGPIQKERRQEGSREKRLTGGWRVVVRLVLWFYLVTTESRERVGSRSSRNKQRANMAKEDKGGQAVEGKGRGAVAKNKINKR
jgi:hypothetical protein